MAERGWIEQTRVPIEPGTGLVDPEDIRKAIRPDTKLIAVTHASNVTGTVQPVREIGRSRASTASRWSWTRPIRGTSADRRAGRTSSTCSPLRVTRDCSAPAARASSTSARHREDPAPAQGRRHGIGQRAAGPARFPPDKYEPGSHNAIGIAGLAAGVAWVAEQTVEKLYEHDLDLVRTFIDGVSDVEGLIYHGPQGVRHRVGVFSVQVSGYDAHELAVILETTYGILTRPASTAHRLPMRRSAPQPVVARHV
jgi:selenocysteine lyase/cysteine desulfurase